MNEITRDTQDVLDIVLVNENLEEANNRCEKSRAVLFEGK